jgi:hypothetical protein
MDLSTLKLEFAHSVQEMELILAGLKKLPMEAVMELYTKLHASAKQQVDDHIASQITPTPEAPAETTAEAPQA